MGSAATPTLCVVSADPSLRRSLARWVDERAKLRFVVKEIDSLADMPETCVVLTTAADCSPARAAALVQRGCRIIVVAAYPSESSMDPSNDDSGEDYQDPLLRELYGNLDS